ncbi:hypothetical protein HGI30_04425 [Paenibacillus albicereus]|uniref:Thiamine pyrophosphate enzyme central domain-containing protein n=1 Tax=Paenibacillus albicereus TaxID=2726185 RepID=A0A6H2GU41_9BACL|nr:hypothetical protein [Paenibacillus albicereus]QJC50879.1 hypothetical protein HGI30_04425 [Paenibacillus albicereus]
MNGSDVVMTIWAEKGLRQIYCDRVSDSAFVRELAEAARRAGLSVRGCASLAAALSAAEGYALASGSPAAAIGTSAELSRAEAATIRALSASSVPLLLLLPGCAGRPSRAGSGFKSTALLQQHDNCRSPLEKAYFLAARHGRKGPALVRLAPSFACGRSLRLPASMPAYEDSGDYMDRLVSEPPIRDEQLDRIADGLSGARRPLIVVGGGVLHAGAAAELGQFLALTGIPAAPTPGGWSALTGDGAIASALPIRELRGRADYALVLGSGEPAPASAGARIDIDPAALERPEEAALEPVQSDIRLFLTALSARWLARELLPLAAFEKAEEPAVAPPAPAAGVRSTDAPDSPAVGSTDTSNRPAAACRPAGPVSPGSGSPAADGSLHAPPSDRPAAVPVPAAVADAAMSCTLPGTLLLVRRGWPGLPELLGLLRLRPGQRLLLLAGPPGCEADAALGASHGAPGAGVSLLLPAASGAGVPLPHSPSQGALSARLAQLRRPAPHPKPKA